MDAPEVVWHVLCPKAKEEADGGTINPIMVVEHHLSDVAGQQWKYRCPLCGTLVSINYPPEV